MEVTVTVSVEPQDPHEWSPEGVTTFVRSLGPAECFKSVGDQVMQLGVDDSVFFVLSLNELEGVCGHTRVYHHMCEFTQNITDARERTVTEVHSIVNETCWLTVGGHRQAQWGQELLGYRQGVCQGDTACREGLELQ